MDSPKASYKNYLLTINHLPMYLVLKNLWMRVRDQRHWHWNVRSGGVGSRDPPLAFQIDARHESKDREVVSEDNKFRRMQSQSHRWSRSRTSFIQSRKHTCPASTRMAILSISGNHTKKREDGGRRVSNVRGRQEQDVGGLTWRNECHVARGTPGWSLDRWKCCPSPSASAEKDTSVGGRV